MAAQAADLGGNCCADLEERVAELEATAARKGNRKVSLTVSGQVNEAVVFWDDGRESNVYVVTNENSRSRFRFVGDAKITPDWSAGYLLEFGVRAANSAAVSQVIDDNTASTASVDLRHSAWYLDSKQLGRLWVGQTSTATDGITEINLANVQIANNDINNWNGGFFLRRKDGVLSTITWGGISSQANANVGEGDRNRLIRYVSPTLAGFIFSASWGEDDFWDVALRYAGEFGGFRVAAGVGYQKWTDGPSNTLNTTTSNQDRGCAEVNSLSSDVDCYAVGLSGSIMHVPTGLYVSGAYGYLQDDNRDALYGANVKDRDEHWYVQGGIEQKWFGLGKTTLYGEYFKGDTGAALTSGGIPTAANVGTLGGAARIGSSEVEVWGLGVNQSIDAAAMDLYLGYRNYSAEVCTSATGAGCTVKVTPEDWWAVMTGAIIRF